MKGHNIIKAELFGLIFYIPVCLRVDDRVQKCGFSLPLPTRRLQEKPVQYNGCIYFGLLCQQGRWGVGTCPTLHSQAYPRAWSLLQRFSLTVLPPPLCSWCEPRGLSACQKQQHDQLSPFNKMHIPTQYAAAHIQEYYHPKSHHLIMQTAR